MKLNIEQQSQAWSEFRAKGIGSSDIAAVMGKSPYKSAHRLWLEKTNRAQPEDLSQNPIVQKGVRLEPEARRASNAYYNRDFEPCVFQSDLYPFMRFSADGYDEDSGQILEIKVPMKSTHDKIKGGEIPEHYRLQVQYGLLVSGSSMAKFVSYRPEDSDDMLAVLTIEPDYELHKRMIEAAQIFWGCVETNTPLPGTSEQNELVGTIKTIQNIKDKIKELEEMKEKLEVDLKFEMKTDHVFAGEYVLSFSERKGSIDYGKIKELDGVDLELYRKPSTRAFSIRKQKV